MRIGGYETRTLAMGLAFAIACSEATAWAERPEASGHRPATWLSVLPRLTRWLYATPSNTPAVGSAEVEQSVERKAQGQSPEGTVPTVTPEQEAVVHTRSVSSTMDGIRTGLGRIEGLRDQAREAVDMLKLRCVKARLTSGRKTADDARALADRAFQTIEAGSKAEIREALEALDSAAETMSRLVTEAESCAGANEVAKNEATMEVDGGGDGGGSGGGGGGFGGSGGGASAPAPGPAVPPVASSF